MRTCLLNLPYPARIMRRYTCTYYPPNFLFPPLELMYLGSIIKVWKKDNCILIDAIAEGLNLPKVIKRLKQYNPDFLVFTAGIETFSEDMQTIEKIKSLFPLLKIASIGYLPTIFPKETLEKNPAIDYIIMNEPEVSFSEVYDEIKINKLTDISIKGIAKRYNGRLIIGEERPRIKNLDIFPFPDRSSLRLQSYNEFLLPQPFTTILGSRGCPFECTFCIRTYGREVAFRSIENILNEIEEVILRYKIKTIRFMDDTFTLNKNRVIELCNSILKKGIKFQWSALSRVNTIDKEMLSLMEQSGCRRLYLGIETASQRLLDFYRKGYRAELIRDQVKMIKKNDIEVVGFFIVGGIQTEAEFKQDVSLAKEINVDYIVVEKLTAYPNTRLFDDIKDKQLEEKALEWEKIFYKDFYFRPRYIIDKIEDSIFNIKGVYQAIKNLGKYILFCSSLPDCRIGLN